MTLKQPMAQPFDVALAHLKAQRPGGMVGIGFDAPYQSSLQWKRGLLLDAELAVDGVSATMSVGKFSTMRPLRERLST